MGVSIKDPEAERLLRELAEKLDVGLTEAVRIAASEAIARRAATPKGESDQDIEADIERILAEFRKLEVVDPRPLDELMKDEEPW